MPKNAVIFLTGRLMALVVLLAFQVVLVRVLPAAEYAVFALVFGFATLMQTAVSLGIPRVIAKYVSQAGWRIRNRTIHRLALWLLLARVVGTAALMLATFALLRLTGLAGPVETRLLVVGGLFILAGVVQLDADAMAQALMKQRMSRNVTVGEAILRLALVSWLVLAGGLHGAADVLEIGAATSLLAGAVLLAAVFRALSAEDTVETLERLDRKELTAIALSSYASSMAWFASSPAVIRFIGGKLLAVQTFAGFAFSQSLVLSFQRYTPGYLIFPFLEPSVMKHFARTGDRSRLQAALSLVVKIDMIVIGAAVVGTAVAGPPIVGLLTGGKYMAEAYALPWLLIYITTSSLYKSFEIVAIALGAASVLLKTLLLSLFWLAAAILLAQRFGLNALLLCPVGDALSRLFLMRLSLSRIGIRHVIDLRVTFLCLCLLAICSAAGAQAAGVLDGTVARIGAGTIAALVYLAAMISSRPLRPEEAGLAGDKPGGLPPLLLRLAR